MNVTPKPQVTPLAANKIKTTNPTPMQNKETIDQELVNITIDVSSVQQSRE